MRFKIALTVCMINICKFVFKPILMSYSPITIANYFIKKYSAEDGLTPMKLIKLTYIADGWYIALTDDNEKLITEDAEAWQYGPVISSLYHKLKHYGNSVVKEPIPTNLNEEISDEDTEFLDLIWQKYGSYDAIYLSAITHTEGSPWSITYPKGYNLSIPKELIQRHYEGLMANNIANAD